MIVDILQFRPNFSVTFTLLYAKDFSKIKLSWVDRLQLKFYGHLFHEINKQFLENDFSIRKLMNEDTHNPPKGRENKKAFTWEILVQTSLEQPRKRERVHAG